MGDGAILSARDLRYLISFLVLCIPVCLICFWLLIPRLSSTAQLLASVMLAAQILVIVMSLFIQPSTTFEERLWNINKEFNIPSVVASTQIAVVAGVALLSLCCASARPPWFRLYLLFIGAIFSLVAIDEFFTWKSYTTESNWIRSILVLGAITVAATLVVAAYSPRRIWKWHLCLLIGLAMNALGALFIDQLTISGTGYLEESLEILGTWIALIAVLGHLTDLVPLPRTRIKLLLWALPAISIFLLLLYHLIPRLEMRLVAQPANVQYQSEISLRGYRIDRDGGKFNIRLYSAANVWRWNSISSDLVGYSVDLIDQASGDSVANYNELVSKQLEFLLFGPEYTPVYRDATELTIPPTTPANRALWLVLTFWRNEDGDYVRQNVVQSDLPLLSDSQVILGEFVRPASTAAPSAAPLARFDNRFILTAATLPERATAGAGLPIVFGWRSETEGPEDLAQFLHLGHRESGEWWVYDQPPLGARLPTRLWYSGMADTETWAAPLPADLAPGIYAVFTGLYRQSDKERLLATSADGRQFLDARIPIGVLTVER